MQASLQSTLHAPTIFESWLPMDSDIFRKGNCNVRLRIDRRTDHDLIAGVLPGHQ